MNTFHFSKSSFHSVVFPKSKPAATRGIAREFPFRGVILLSLIIFPEHRSKMEIAVHEVMESFFINHYVLANIDLALLFDVQEINRVLGEFIGGFAKRSSHVDFCVVSLDDRYPYICFELDGPHHHKRWNTYQRIHDSWKNEIFHRSGIPLIRLIPTIPFRDDQISETMKFRDDFISLMADLSIHP